MRTAIKQIAPAPRPMITDEIGPTKPEAGVIATRPATTPLATPRVVGLPRTNHSRMTHPRAPAAAPVFVATKAETARPLAASALPALKPNQPAHRSPAPARVKVRLCGGIGSRR